MIWDITFLPLPILYIILLTLWGELSYPSSSWSSLKIMCIDNHPIPIVDHTRTTLFLPNYNDNIEIFASELSLSGIKRSSTDHSPQLSHKLSWNKKGSWLRVIRVPNSNEHHYSSILNIFNKSMETNLHRSSLQNPNMGTLHHGIDHTQYTHIMETMNSCTHLYYNE